MKRTILATLIVCFWTVSGLCWINPDSTKLSASFSIRERTDESVNYFEWEALTGISYLDLWEIEAGYEREADRYWWILKSGGTKYQLFAGLDGEYQITQQGEIDRQSLMIGKHWHGVGMLVGATTQRWNPSRTEGAYVFKLPLYWGYIRYMTDFEDFRQYEAKFRFPKNDGMYYIKGEWFQEDDRVYRKLKMGISPTLADINLNCRKLISKTRRMLANE